MPTTAQILEVEDANSSSIVLHSEGMFWKAYQQSAFLLTQDKPTLKPTKKFVKAVAREVVSVGFPKSALENYIDTKKITSQTESRIEATHNPIDPKAYQEWLDEIELKQTPEKQTNEQATTCHAEVIDKIRRFRLESSSPMQCMAFIETIQKQLDGNI